MIVPNHMEITASLMAGYRFDDGSLLEVDAAGDYRITDAEGTVIGETVDTAAGKGEGLRFGTKPEDYGEIMDDLAAFLLYYGTTDSFDEVRRSPFPIGVLNWVPDHEDELSILACYREDKRLGEGFFASEAEED